MVTLPRATLPPLGLGEQSGHSYAPEFGSEVYPTRLLEWKHPVTFPGQESSPPFPSPSFTVTQQKRAEHLLHARAWLWAPAPSRGISWPWPWVWGEVWPGDQQGGDGFQMQPSRG